MQKFEGEELRKAESYDREHWGPPHLHERYSRVANKAQYDKNLEESNIGKDVNPMLARRFHKSYGVIKGTK